ncbi:MAG TPA: SIS domain-containing protein [Flavisolibacter sp.]|jgi:tagatose-6-phosphate ketose/aldose isomerase|nr:SIS domain-containing protein [Flavisolibacter sp.]
MQYLGLDLATLIERGACHTAKEIAQQPELWCEIYKMIEARETEIKQFLESSYAIIDTIILTGAGSSGFLGKTLEGIFFKKSGIPCRAVLTTDLVSHPHDYFNKQSKVLLISFARSGDSPESDAAVQLADQIAQQCMHIIITCNEEGMLATTPTKHPRLLVTLPSRANDQSLAMTSSFTGMLLAGALLAYIRELSSAQEQVTRLSHYGNKLIKNYTDLLKSVSSLGFRRAVFLGSGPLFGIAMESELKLQELSNGKIICKHDSFLGFRHGPKAVVDEYTLVVYLFSNTPYAIQYEKDLLISMRKGKKALFELGIAQHAIPAAGIPQLITLAKDQEQLEEIFWSIVTVLPAQILGFFKSLQLGLEPDSPSTHGAISRVVEGVSIYPLSLPV